MDADHPLSGVLVPCLSTATTLPADAAALNTGILCDGLRVVDIDVEDAAIAGQIEAIAFDMLGAAPVRGRENSAKRAIIYRAAEGEPRKRVRSGPAGKVEVLGHGQQVHAFGMHPSGAALRWRPAPLDTVPRADLPTVTEEAPTAFLAAVAPLIGVDPRAVDAAGTGDREAADQAALAAPSLDILVEALQHVPNQGGRDGWIRMGHAIKAAGGTVEMWEEWSNRWDGRPEDPDDLARRWEGFRPPFLAGWRHVERAAREASGWVGGVAAEFEAAGLDLAALAAQPAAREGRSGRFRVLTMADCTGAPARRYIIKGALARGDLGIVVGSPGAGKSALAPYLAHAVAQGRGVFGRKVRGGPTLYLAAEDGHGMQDRFRVLRDGVGDTPSLFLLPDGANPGDPKDVAELQAIISERRITLVVVDTLAAAFPGIRENESEDLGRAVAALRALSGPTGAAVLLVHHDAKNGDRSPRGHSILNGAADVTFRVEAVGDTGNARRVTLGKNRNGPADMEWGFIVRSAPAGVDEDGDAHTAAILAEMPVGERAPARLSKQVGLALDLLRELLTKEGEQLPGDDGFPGGAVPGVREAAWRDLCRRRGLSSASDRAGQGKEFGRARDELRAKGRIGVCDGWVWMADAGRGGTTSE